jgi:hypothetical protein
MGERLRGVIRLVIVLAVGIFVGSAISQWRPLPESERVSSPRNVMSEGLGRVRVEVLNAGGEDGMARLATEHLRDHGFDVVFFGNAEAFGQDSTVVLDRSGRIEAALAVGGALGSTSVESRPDANLYLDVTVLLGRDWVPGTPPEEAIADGVPWWDLRRHLR